MKKLIFGLSIACSSLVIGSLVVSVIGEFVATIITLLITFSGIFISIY